MELQAMDLDSDHHPLLEPPSPKYSNLTVRRAYIVWLRCGQKNEFADVCNYYHRLEQFENQLSQYTRAISRHHEFSLFIMDPPTSPYQMSLFPNLYSAHHQPKYNSPVYNQVCVQPRPTNQTLRQSVIIKEIIEPAVPAKMEEQKSPEVSPEEIFEASQMFKTPEHPINDKIATKLGDCIINSQDVNINTTDEQIIVESNKDKNKEGVPEADVLKTIQLVNNYCREQQVPVRNFWKNFNEYALRCELCNTVYNVSHYIKNKMVQSELPMALFEIKVKSIEKIKKTQPKVEKETNETQDSPSSSCEQDEVEIRVDEYTEMEKEHIRKVNEFNEDLISFVDRITREQEEKVKKFFEESSLGYSNADDDEHDECSKCRKI